jgi:hypothetical protein
MQNNQRDLALLLRKRQGQREKAQAHGGRPLQILQGRYNKRYPAVGNLESGFGCKVLWDGIEIDGPQQDCQQEQPHHKLEEDQHVALSQHRPLEDPSQHMMWCTWISQEGRMCTHPQRERKKEEGRRKEGRKKEEGRKKKKTKDGGKGSINT